MSSKNIFSLSSALVIALCSSSFAQDSLKEQSLEKIFTLREPKAFHSAMEEAKAAGVHKQALLEANFLFLVDTGTPAQIAALAEDMKAQREHFSLEDSQIFSIEEDWLAVVHYTQALAALEQSDRTAFKAHITEAFWLSPRQGSAFAPHIEQLHLDDAMTQVKLPPEQPFIFHTEEGSTTFSELIKDKKALLIHFWSPWSRESDETFDDFLKTAQECQKHGIEVIALLADPNPEVMKDAKDFLASRKGDTGFTWIIDNTKQPLTRIMRLQQFPNFVLLSPEGHVLFNGAPTDPQLWLELTDIAPSFERPNSESLSPKPLSSEE